MVLFYGKKDIYSSHHNIIINTPFKWLTNRSVCTKPFLIIYTPFRWPTPFNALVTFVTFKRAAFSFLASQVRKRNIAIFTVSSRENNRKFTTSVKPLRMR